MSQEFKDQFAEMQQGNRMGVGSENTRSDKHYDTPGHVRNLCFLWPDGRMKFLNYAYLISGDYIPEDGRIILLFTNVSIVIDGTDLSRLFDDLISHKPRLISYSDSRYNHLTDVSNLTITDIKVIQNE